VDRQADTAPTPSLKRTALTCQNPATWWEVRHFQEKAHYRLYIFSTFENLSTLRGQGSLRFINVIYLIL
uniref:Uncharacterized protein n=1 Tax=Macaca fascicularis TaxID=9541 RepID=A0A7N9CYE9_MACFA